MLVCLMQIFRISVCKLGTTAITIHGLNVHSSWPVGKISLKCQIGDLKLEITCHVINLETSYNLLLER